MNDVCHSRDSGGFRGRGGRLSDGAWESQGAGAAGGVVDHWRGGGGDHFDRQSAGHSKRNPGRDEGGIWRFRLRQRSLSRNTEADLYRASKSAERRAYGAGERRGESVQERVVRK